MKLHKGFFSFWLWFFWNFSSFELRITLCSRSSFFNRVIALKHGCFLCSIGDFVLFQQGLWFSYYPCTNNFPFGTGNSLEARHYENRWATHWKWSWWSWQPLCNPIKRVFVWVIKSAVKLLPSFSNSLLLCSHITMQGNLHNSPQQHPQHCLC